MNANTTSSASAATKRFRQRARSAVARFSVEGNGETIVSRPFFESRSLRCGQA